MTQSAPALVQVKRIEATPEAVALIERLRAKYGDIMFHQTGSTRDDATPLCYPEDEFFLGQCDVCLGGVAGVPYYVSKPQFAVWQEMQLTLGVAPGRGGTFSLENGLGVRFVLASRPFTADELGALAPVKRGCPDGGPAEHAR